MRSILGKETREHLDTTSKLLPNRTKNVEVSGQTWGHRFAVYSTGSGWKGNPAINGTVT